MRPMLNNKTILLTIVTLSAGILLSAQDIPEIHTNNITGKVIDASTGLPVEGIGVSVAELTTTFTDSAGSFTLNLPGNDFTVRVSGMGYQNKEVHLKGRENVDILVYETGYKSFQENVYMHYSQPPAIYNINSATALNLKNNNWKYTAASPEEILKGKVAGAQIKNRSGVPGIGSNIYIRGYSSLYCTNQPLIVVDGQPYINKQYGMSVINGYANNPLASININDIENITVIKDAASIYGAQGANGVILIQTNHTDEMVTKIDFTSYGGIRYAPRQMPLLQADDYRRYLAEIYETKGITPDSIQKIPFFIDDLDYDDYYRFHNNTNWQDKVFTNSYIQSHNLKISGGDDIALYSISVGYLDHDGIIKNTGYSRYTVRFNSDIKISPKLLLNTNMAFTYNQHSLKDDGYNKKTNPVYLSLFKSPLFHQNLRGYNGAISPKLEDADILGIGNPVAIVEDLSAISNNYKIIGSFNASYQLSRNLTVNNQIGINFDKIRENLFVPHLGFAGDTLDLGIAENTMVHKVERIFSLNNDLRFLYTKTLNLKHNISGLAGIRTGVNQLQDDWSKDYNSPNDFLRSIGNGVNYLRKAGGDLATWKNITYYANAGYNYHFKYFLSVNMSLDGSSRFGEEANGIHLHSGTMGVFPSVSAVWIVSSEEFLAGLKDIDFLKIRLSYGLTGNDDIGNYLATKYYIEQNFLGLQGVVKGILANPALQWETSKKFNSGIDVALFNDRLSASIDLYRNKTINMINVSDADPLSGFSSYISNSGSFVSRGIDFTLSSRIINGKFKWDIGAVWSKYKTKITEFPDNSRITTVMGANILTKEDEPLGLFYGYKTQGVFSTHAAAENSQLRALMPNTALVHFSAGDVIFIDKDDNFIINEQDMEVIGDPNPDFFGMFSSRLEWKGIALDAEITFCYGNDVFNFLRYKLESMQNADNQSLIVLNRWRGEGQQTNIPRAVWGDPIGNSRFSDRWIEDGSYMRLKRLTISYRFPATISYLNSLELFFTGQNLFTFTKYLGMDPEFSMNESPLTQGIDIGLTPQAKSVSLGIKIGL